MICCLCLAALSLIKTTIRQLSSMQICKQPARNWLLKSLLFATRSVLLFTKLKKRRGNHQNRVIIKIESFGPKRGYEINSWTLNCKSYNSMDSL